MGGVGGKIAAVQWAREQKIPYFGLCLGMQVMLVELGRNKLGLKGANSTEVDADTPHPIINLQEEQQDVTHKGASMRLGTYLCSIRKDSKAYRAYGKDSVYERHRHRYEFNNAYREQFEGAGVIFSGIYEENDLIEIAELQEHPFMLGVQFHPEFLSSPLLPHPLFKAFVGAVLQHVGGK